MRRLTRLLDRPDGGESLRPSPRVQSEDRQVVARALSLQGQSAEIVAALASLAPERERALAILRRARTPLAAVRRLAGKGFSADVIESALAALPGEEATEATSS